jgi:hypothetical protein
MHVLHQQKKFPSNQECHFPHDTCNYLIRRHHITDVTGDQDRRFCKYAKCHFVYRISRKLQSCRAVSIPSMTSSSLVTATSLAHAGSFSGTRSNTDKGEHFCFVFQQLAIVPLSTCTGQTKALFWEINSSASKDQ